MGKDQTIIDSDGIEAKVTAALEALKVDLIDSAGVTIEDLETVLEAIETLLQGTQLSKIWDGTHTLDVNADGSIPVTGTVTAAQATPANLKTLIYGDFGGTPTVVAVDTGGKLKVTF